MSVLCPVFNRRVDIMVAYSVSECGKRAWIADKLKTGKPVICWDGILVIHNFIWINNTINKTAEWIDWIFKRILESHTNFFAISREFLKNVELESTTITYALT